MALDSTDILFETRGPVAVVTINRPEQRNAINTAVREGLFAAWSRFESDETLRVAILTGAGRQAFCAGLDLKEVGALNFKVPPPGFLPIIGDNVHVSKPVIAAVNGSAFAGGWMFAQMCDLCIAANHATFGITEAKVGRGMPWAAPLVGMLPQRIVMELLLTGDAVSAERAREIGFVNQVVAPDDLLTKAMEMAEKIASNAPLTVRAARELVYLSAEMGRSAALRAAQHLFTPVYMSEDAQEGPRAFKERRKPQWNGR